QPSSLAWPRALLCRQELPVTPGGWRLRSSSSDRTGLRSSQGIQPYGGRATGISVAAVTSALPLSFRSLRSPLDGDVASPLLPAPHLRRLRTLHLRRVRGRPRRAPPLRR